MAGSGSCSFSAQSQAFVFFPMYVYFLLHVLLIFRDLDGRVAATRPSNLGRMGAYQMKIEVEAGVDIKEQTSESASPVHLSLF